MAYQMYQQRRSNNNYYDMRGMPPYYQPPSYNGYFPYQHPMETEYQRSRPTKLTPRVLNKRFKKVTIQLNENKVLVVSVNLGKGSKPFLVFSQCEGSYENKTNSVSIPESLVVPFIQQLHKLSKWRPSTSGNLPTGQGLTYEDSVFRTQVTCVSGSEVPLESRLYAIKILAEARARDPQDRKELASVSVPLETSYLMKLKEALNDVIVSANESPLYHSKSFQGADGSKFYLDLIRDDEAHYLKVSQVTRDFRSILHVPAEDLDAFKELLEVSVKAMKGQLDEQKVGGGSANKKRRSRQGRRRTQKRSDGNKGSQSNSECEEAKENSNPSEAKQKECKEEARQGDDQPAALIVDAPSAPSTAVAESQCEDNKPQEQHHQEEQQQ